MVAKISIGSSLYGVLAYNAQKVNAGEGKLLAVNGVFDACTGKIDLARTFKDFDRLLPKGNPDRKARITRFAQSASQRPTHGHRDGKHRP